MAAVGAYESGATLTAAPEFLCGKRPSGHCHHGMARPIVADEGDGLQIRRTAADVLNKQLSSSLGFG
jgi:hypothetical protein